MQLSCPNCSATYQVPDDAIGPNGRKIRCRACDTSWFQQGPPLAPPLSLTPIADPGASVSVGIGDSGQQGQAVDQEPTLKRRRGPWLLLGLVILVVMLGGVAAAILMGPQQMASRLGLGGQRVPLGIAITREPDWRMIAGGSQLFAVSGRIWNPTNVEQPVPDIRAELKDAQGKTVYSWTITRPVPRLAPGASVNFDGAAVDVPPSSSKVNVTFAGSEGG